MINATDLYFITRYCDNKTNTISKLYPNLEQVVWKWKESYYAETTFWYFNVVIELHFDKMLVYVGVYKVTDDSEKLITDYTKYIRNDITFNEFNSTLKTYIKAAKDYIKEQEKCN